MSHAYLCGSALRVALELRNSQPQSVLRFCVLSGQKFFAFGSSLWHRLRLRFELRNSQPQFVFRFCDFLDVNLQGFVWKFFLPKNFLIPENGTYRPRPREGLGRTPELGRLPILRTSVDLPETANFREQYFCGAAIQSPKQLLLLLLLPNCPPIISYLSYLI